MQRTFGQELAIMVTKAIVIIISIVVLFIFLHALYEEEIGVGDGICNVAVLPIEGTILPYHGVVDFPLIVTPETVERFMDTVESQPEIKAVLAEINSPGGTPVAAERIAGRFRSSSIPVIGLIGDVGASGGYMVAAATDHLIASPMSDVGSIGVTMSYLENSIQNENDGLTYVQLTTGKFKDAGSPDRPITDEERELFQKDLDIVHNEFVRLVATYRNKTIEEIQTLADGSSMTGARALEAGLIDGLGGRTEARQVLANTLELSPDEIIFCEYESPLLPF
jgi:protease IV